MQAPTLQKLGLGERSTVPAEHPKPLALENLDWKGSLEVTKSEALLRTGHLWGCLGFACHSASVLDTWSRAQSLFRDFSPSPFISSDFPPWQPGTAASQPHTGHVLARGWVTLPVGTLESPFACTLAMPAAEKGHAHPVPPAT